MKAFSKKRNIGWLLAALGSYVVSCPASDIQNDSLLKKVFSDKTKTNNAEDELVKPDVSWNANQDEGRVIARLKVGYDQNIVFSTLSRKGVQFHVVKSFFVNTPETGKSGQLDRSKQQILVIYSNEKSTQSLIEILHKIPGVDLVEPDYNLSIE